MKPFRILNLHVEFVEAETACQNCVFDRSLGLCDLVRGRQRCGVQGGSWQKAYQVQEFFLLRHAATGVFMPMFAFSKGYSYWSPGETRPWGLEEGSGVPRMFTTEKQAQGAKRMWLRGEYSKDDRGRVTYIKGQRRSADLEIVRMEVNFDRLDTVA